MHTMLKFLGTQRALSVRANVADKPSFVDCTLHPNLSLAFLDTYSQRNEKFVKQYVDDKRTKATIYWAQGQNRSHNKSQRLSIVHLKNRKHLTPIGITSDNVTLFQAQNAIKNNKNNLILDNSRIISSESLHSSKQHNVDRDILFSSNDGILKTSVPHDNEGKPSQEQLQSIVDCLSQDLPKLFVKPQNWSIYTEDIIFINNIRGITTKGLSNYARHLILLRAVGHLKFAHVKLDIIKITMHTEDNTVKVRWRIRGVSGWKVIVMFWKYKFWKIQEAIDRDHEIWYDGFSTYYVNGHGKVYKHVADKIMPDQDVVTKKEDLPITPKLALFTGLASMFDSNEDYFGLNSNLKLHQLK
ncbi:uncharacterized protein [Linepithema humile]|uniref:uncharacterized protein isoform X2 n=1 Tax=Linepithema humile TaxID=83485 RepID=UPI0006235291|nr:PREDICTED: uncharacterized protein LOC105668237 isoform X2 [Linepithema humile]